MMKVNGNSDFDESGLLPYPVIIAATKGDPDAVKAVVKHYEGYISSLATRSKEFLHMTKGTHTDMKARMGALKQSKSV
jgi:hypothetical protein